LSLATAILTGDVAELPSKRDEDWRWTDLRGLVRTLPPASPVYEGELAPGPFAADETLTIVNGHGSHRIHVLGGESRTVAVRFVSHGDETAHMARLEIEVEAGASLTLLESYEGQGRGYVASADLDIRLARNARLERIVLADDDAEAVSVSSARVAPMAGAILEQTVPTTGAKRQRVTQLVCDRRIEVECDDLRLDRLIATDPVPVVFGGQSERGVQSDAERPPVRQWAHVEHVGNETCHAAIV